MPVRGALSVRVNDGQTDRIVTRYCRGLKFSKVAPGGHHQLSCTMVLPRNTFSDLGPEDRVYVYDARTTRTVWEGYLENPTPVDVFDGQAYAVSAIGGVALANDESRALVYVDKSLGGWIKAPDGTPGATVDSGDTVGAAQGLRTQFPQGETIATGAVASAGYYLVKRAGMTLGALRVTIVAGIIDANYLVEIITDTGSAITGAMGTTPGTVNAYVGTDFLANSTVFGLRLRRTGGGVTVADDLHWMLNTNIVVIGQRMNRSGTLLTTSTGLVSNTQVLASQVVEDLLGRLLTFCDAGTAQVDVTAFGIDQLAWPDGVKAVDVLTSLDLYEPNFTWEILESGDNGKHRFNYRAWSTTPRYVVSVQDGWQQNGSDVDLCNRILVTWTDPAGQAQVTAVTAASLGLTGQGLPIDALGSRIKDADPASLPEYIGSSANATRYGGQILTDKVNPPRAGTVLVRRPILDLLMGSWVMPWELEPGYVCRIRETGDELRITQAEYDDDSCSTLLTLGTPELTREQRLARLSRSVGVSDVAS